MGKIIFVGSSWVFAKYISLACSILGFEPIFLGNMDFYSQDVQMAIKKCEYYNVDITSVDKMYDLIAEKNVGNIVGIISSADTKLVNSILLSQKLGVKSLDVNLLEISDKSAVAKLIPEYSPEGFTFNKTDIPYNKIEDIIIKHKVVFLKPVHGSGALGVKKLTKIEEVKALGTYLSTFKNDDWIVQQSIEGELYSIEGYCIDGEIKILGFNLRDRIQTTEMSNHFPVDNILKKKVREDSLEALRLLVTRSGYKNGYFHCEFLSDGEKVYLIDPNFGRIGGGAILEQIAISFNLSPEQIVAHVISVGLFGKELNDISFKDKIPTQSISISFGLEKSSTYLGIVVPHKLRSQYYTAIANENTVVSSIGQDDYSWIGILAGTEKEVFEDIKNIKIRTVDGDMVAKYFIRSDLKKTIIAN